MRAGRAAVLAFLLAGAGCGGPSAPGDVVVARIEGEDVTLDAFQAWMETAVPGTSPGRLPGVERISDPVRSRLFDQYLDERLLAREAERRGVVVGEEGWSKFRVKGRAG